MKAKTVFIFLIMKRFILTIRNWR